MGFVNYFTAPFLGTPETPETQLETLPFLTISGGLERQVFCHLALTSFCPGTGAHAAMEFAAGAGV